MASPDWSSSSARSSPRVPPRASGGSGIGGLLIGLGGIALAFIANGAQLLFFSPAFVMAILTPLLLLMTLAFTWGFVKDIKR